MWASYYRVSVKPNTDSGTGSEARKNTLRIIPGDILTSIA